MTHNTMARRINQTGRYPDEWVIDLHLSSTDHNKVDNLARQLGISHSQVIRHIIYHTKITDITRNTRVRRQKQAAIDRRKSG